MADIINLNRARKEKARAEKAAKSGGHRFFFGCSKAEREAAANKARLEAARLDGHKRED